MPRQVSAATLAGGAAPNEDYYLVSDSWAIVLDGVTRYPDDGCLHDVPWYVAALGAALAGELEDDRRDLRGALAGAIETVAQRHRGTCDLSNPVSPAATVALARFMGDRFDWLVLGDCAVTWQRVDEEPHVETDTRLADLTDPPAAVEIGGLRRYSVEYLASVRNRPGGFWVASADPEAAAAAYCGGLGSDELSAAALFSDGLTRLVDRYGYSWRTLVRTGVEQGVPCLLARVREAENADPDLHARGKPHDDATGVVLQME